VSPGVTTGPWTRALTFLRRDAPPEPHVEALVRRIVRPGWLCADVGAHHGSITRIMAEATGPTGRVVAFEAHPVNARTLARRVRRHDGRVTVEALAVSDGTRDRVMLFGGRGGSSAEWTITGRGVDGREGEPGPEVRAVALDAYFPSGEGPRFVKLDAESAEAEVLHGMRRVVREDRPALVIEFHDERGWAARRVLLDAGYRLWDARDGSALAPEDPRAYHCLALPPEHTEAPF
jgi:FkbM family methyltransferase